MFYISLTIGITFCSTGQMLRHEGEVRCPTLAVRIQCHHKGPKDQRTCDQNKKKYP